MTLRERYWCGVKKLLLANQSGMTMSQMRRQIESDIGHCEISHFSNVIREMTKKGELKRRTGVDIPLMPYVYSLNAFRFK